MASKAYHKLPETDDIQFTDRPRRQSIPQQSHDDFQSGRLIGLTPLSSTGFPYSSPGFNASGSADGFESEWPFTQKPSSIESQSEVNGNPWRPGIWEQFPVLGISALIGTILCTLTAVGILIASNRQSIDHWSGQIQPTVYLSVTSALANMLLTFALSEGVVNSFWRGAGRGGSLQNLHYCWSAGVSLWAALRGVARWKGKATGFACIMTIFSTLRGPLFQRASTVRNINSHYNGIMQVHIAQQLPVGYTGQDTGRTSSTSLLTPNFTQVIQDYTKQNAMLINHSDCGDSCITAIKGFGFGVTCNMSSLPYILDPIVSPRGSVSLRDPVEVFSTSVGLVSVPDGANHSTDAYADPNTALLLNSTFMSTPTQAWNGSLAMHLCTLRGGVVSYPVVISSSTVSLQSPHWQNDTFLEDTHLDPPPYGNDFTIVGGFELAANNLFDSAVTMQFGGGVGWIVEFQGSISNQYLNPNIDGGFVVGFANNMTWRDPMDDMINAMRQIAFRTALRAAADNTTLANSTQTVAFAAEDKQTVYISNYGYMIIAALVSLSGVVAIIPTYTGWWELGRAVSLSPLEIAKAFDAPLLKRVDCNAEATQILVAVGHRTVKYGEVERSDRAEDALPGGGGDAGVRRRLEVFDARFVKEPVAGRRYGS